MRQSYELLLLANFLFETYGWPKTSDQVYKTFRSLFGGESPSVVPDISAGKYVLSSFFANGRLPFEFSPYVDAQFEKSYGHFHRLLQITEEAASQIDKDFYGVFFETYARLHWAGGTVQGIKSAGEIFGHKTCMPYWDESFVKICASIPEQYGRSLDLNPTKHALKTFGSGLGYPANLQTGPHSYLYDVDASWSAAKDLCTNNGYSKIIRNGVATMLEAYSEDELQVFGMSADCCDKFVNNGQPTKGSEDKLLRAGTYFDIYSAT